MPHAGIGRVSSPSTYATPRPPPTDSSGSPSGFENCRQDLDGLAERVETEHLGTDVGVDADQIDGRRSQRPLDGGRGHTGRHGEPELRVVLTGGDELVRVGFDAGRHPQQHRRHLTRGGMDGFDAVDLVEAVDDDAGDAGVERCGQLGHRLVVAVHHQVRARDAGRQRDGEFAAGGHVEMHALFVGEAGHRPAQKRLRGIGDAVAERVDGFAAASPQVLLVVDEQRAAVLGDQVVDTHATDGEHAVAGHAGVVGQQRQRNGTGHDLAPLHRVGRRDADEIETGCETGPCRFTQPQTGLGELGRDAVAHDVAVVVEAVHGRGMVTEPRHDLVRSALARGDEHQLAELVEAAQHLELAFVHQRA